MAETTRKRRIVDYMIACTNSMGELFLLYMAIVALGAVGFAMFEDKSFGDALWWSIVTSTTTGYGDLSPATWQGRIVAGALMLVSILFILPLLIGYIASALVQNRDAFTHEEQEALKGEIAALRAELARLREPG